MEWINELRALHAEYEPMPLVAPQQATVKMTDSNKKGPRTVKVRGPLLLGGGG